MWCNVCGGEIYPGIESVNGTHADADYCVVILNARVEHEEARAEAAENELGIMRGHAAEAVKIRDLRIAELESQLAALVTGPGGFNERADIIKELKAQLAAQAWRPVTEPPQMADNYHVWRRPGYHDFCHFNGVNWRTTGGDSVTHWQPLPAPPIDPPAPA